MCGIVYARRDSKPASAQIVKRYKKQRERGFEGFGYITISDTGTVEAHKRFQHEEEMLEAIKKETSKHILFHHRYPTSTVNVKETAHPIPVAHEELKYSYYVIHNGVISNHAGLKAKHEALGYKYSTELETIYRTASGAEYALDGEYNDSESLAIELCRTIEGLQSEVCAEGSASYMVLQVKGKKAIAIYYGTNGGNPLTVSNGGGICIASEGGKRITANICYRISIPNGDTKTMPVPFANPYPVKKIGYSEYEHYPNGYDTAGLRYDSKYNEWGMPKKNEAIIEATAESITELESRIYELEASMQVAEQAGEHEEFQELDVEYARLVDQLNELEESIAY